MLFRSFCLLLFRKRFWFRRLCLSLMLCMAHTSGRFKEGRQSNVVSLFHPFSSVVTTSLCLSNFVRRKGSSSRGAPLPITTFLGLRLFFRPRGMVKINLTRQDREGSDRPPNPKLSVCLALSLIYAWFCCFLLDRSEKKKK